MRFQAIRDIGIVATGLAALLIASLAETGAGIFLGSMSQVIALIPGLLVLVPPTIDMRGNISGALVSRLASSMHLGEFEIDLSEQSVLGDNVRVAIITTISISFALGIIASVVTRFIGIDGLNPLDFTLISVMSGVLSGFLLLIFTYILAVASYRYRLDLDLIGAPAVTAAGDIITLPILVVSAIGILWLPSGVRMVLGGAVLGFIIVTAWYTLRRTPRVRSIIRETLLLLIPLAILGVMAGVVYNLDVEQLTSMAALLILIPPFMGVCGSIGGILSSRLATGLHMGVITPTYLPRREAVPYIALTYFYTLILLPFLAVIAHMAAVIIGLPSPGLLLLVVISLSAGLLVMTLVNVISYLIAVISFLYGFDPDNFGIPVITTAIDLLGAIALIAMINLFLT